MAKTMYGKPVAQEIQIRIRDKLRRGGFTPGLHTLLVGNDKSSMLYIRMINKLFKGYGINVHVYEFRETVEQSRLEALIVQLNTDEEVNGVLIQLPLPNGVDKERLFSLVGPLKDVDGAKYVNGNYSHNEYSFKPCTPIAALEMLKFYDVSLNGKRVVIVGKGPAVGKPLELMISQMGFGKLDVCDSKTNDLGEITRCADILVVAAGEAGLIKGEMVKEGAAVIDVGINIIVDNGKEDVVGDVDFNAVSQRASFITPVPGGVGVVTPYCLMWNVVKAYMIQNGLKYDAN